MSRKNTISPFYPLLTKGKFYQHCAEAENQAKEMFDMLAEQMKEAEGITEELKEHNQWKWVQLMGNIQTQARGPVINELIYN